MAFSSSPTWRPWEYFPRSITAPTFRAIEGHSSSNVAACEKNGIGRAVSASRVPAGSVICAPAMSLTPAPLPVGRGRTVAPAAGSSMRGWAWESPSGQGVDRRGDPVPQLDAGAQRGGDGLGALVPLGRVVAAQVGEHGHGHRGVLLAVDLDVPGEVVAELGELAAMVVDLD